MASSTGGGDERRNQESNYHPLRPPSAGRNFERNLSRNDIGNQARFLATQFIHDRLERNGRPAPEADTLREPDTPTGPPVEHIREVARSLRQIGDELDGDENLQRLIARISPDCPQQTFMEVAREIFADGNFNWGRVVALFYFAYKMAIKAIESSIKDVIPLIRMVVEWVVIFIEEYVAVWIIDRGGWEAIQEYFGTPGYQTVGVFLAGVLCSLFLIYLKR